MMLGKYFTLQEMTATGTRAMNNPDDQQLVNLTRLVALILDPLREECGALRVNSGFRSDVVNKLVGGSKGSYHMMGCAADIVGKTSSIETMAEIAQYIALPFDKLIMEYGDNSDWLHIQVAPAGAMNRGEVYTANMVDGAMLYKLQT